MSKYVCKLFGVPQITKDGQICFFPYGKINALLYYLLVVKVASRDEVAGLLWPDVDGVTAKKNIRNALYQAKKSVGQDIIVASQKSILVLNEELELELDVDAFEADPGANLDLYRGDFLQGFYLKDAVPYEYWIAGIRDKFARIFAAECYKKVEDGLRTHQCGGLESLLSQLTAMDEFDERNYRLLMRFYLETGRSSKVIETYFDLVKRLERELGIEPEPETTEIYESLLKRITFGGQSKERSEQSSHLYGRFQEFAAAEKLLREFELGEQSLSLVFQGEFGSGKSVLQRQLLEKAAGRLTVLETSCYQGESEQPLRPWNRLIQGIKPLICRDERIQSLWPELMRDVFPDFSDDLPGKGYISQTNRPPLYRLAHVITETLINLSQDRKVLLAMENLQWMDTESLQVLTSVLLNLPACRVMMLATADVQRIRPLEDMLTELQEHGKLTVLPLRRFSIETCHSFLEKSLSGQKIEGDLLRQIYTETEGNPFFLHEYIGMLSRKAGLDTMTPAMLKTLKARFLYLSPEQLELLQIVSFFDGGAPVSLLPILTGRDEKELFQCLTLLEDRALLAEQTLEQDHIVFFTHIKLREYAYMTQTELQKKLIHEQIAQLLEQFSSQNNIKLNTKLIYHFSQAGNICKAMKYRIATLKHVLNFNHEMFPTLDEMESDSTANIYISRNRIWEIFVSLEEDFIQMGQAADNPAELDRLLLEFNYIKGRYHIRDGNYDEGTEHIAYVITKSKQMNDLWYELESYKQMILLYLQIHDLKKMERYVKLGLEAALSCNAYDQIGIMFRLKGLYNLMAGNFKTAEAALDKSISLLTITPEMARKYSTNIAAAHNYIGEIRQAEGNYPAAMSAFQKAISLCLWCNVSSSLSYFYINAGKNAYIMNRFDEAKEYFEKAYSLYGEFDSFWRRPVLDSYMALTMMIENDFPKVLHYLASAQKSVEHIKDPGELGTVYFAQALIRLQIEQRPELQAIFSKVLIYPADRYCKLSLAKLNRDYNHFEIRLLHQKFK